MRLESFLKTFHAWAGLICGAVLCLTCLSGSIAVFRPQFQAALTPQAASSESYANLDDSVAGVLARNPGARLTRVSLPTPDRNSFILTLDSGDAKPLRIVVDAGTGAMLGEMKAAWLDWIIDLHHNLLAGRAGRRGVGVVGIVLFLISLSGLVLYLKRNPSWRHLTRVATGPRRRVYFELHRATALWTYSFLMLLSFTGIALAFPDAFRAVLGQRSRLAAPAKTSPMRPLEDYLAISRATVPGARWTELRLPESEKDAVSMRFLMAGDWGDVGRNELALDASGRIVGMRRISDQSAGVQVQYALTPIHYGEMGGLGVRVLWSLAGLAPMLLFVTGLLVWFRPKSRQSVNKPTETDETLVTQRSS